jgi:AraC family transcriptional activator of pobA
MKKSHSALYKKLKADTGVSIKNCIDKKLLDNAREHLLLSGLSIKEIAAVTGFRDQYYFSRFFRKHTGMSPTDYRKRNSMP